MGVFCKKNMTHDFFLSVSYQSEEQMGNKEYSGAIEQERYIIFLTNQWILSFTEWQQLPITDS